MCTIVDKDASKKFYEKIKKNGWATGWKLVAVDKKGNYFAPFMGICYHKRAYNLNCGISYLDAKEWWIDKVEAELTHSVFHLFFSRGKARKALKWIRKPKCPYFSYKGSHKIVKVMFRTKDFVAVGQPDDFFRCEWGFFDKNPDNICVTAFKFVE